MNLLETCFNFADDSHKTELSELLESLASGDFFNEFSPDEISSVMEILLKLKNEYHNTSFITKTVFDLASKDLLKNLPPDQAFKAIDILYQCIGDDDQTDLATINAGKALREFISRDFLKEYDPSKILSIIKLIDICSYFNGSKEDVSKIVRDLVSKGLIKETEPSKILPLIDILKRCLDDFDAKRWVSEAIFELASRDLLKKLESYEILSITNILSECSENDDAKPWIAKSIGKMGEKHLLQDHSKEQILNLVELLFSFLGYENAREVAACDAASGLLTGGCYDKFDEYEAQIIKKAFDECHRHIVANKVCDENDG